MRKRYGLVLFAFLALVICLTLSQTSLASERDGQEVPLSPASPQDDGGTAEVGIEWITDWPGTADDRANWYYSANNFYNELGNAGWVKRFNYGNTNAWEKDFKAAMYGGINDYVIDSVDIAMIGTHGSSAYDSRYGKTLSSVYFSSNHDDWHLSPGEAYRAYGNTDLEWLAFDSCSVLRDDSMYYWHETFDGLHLMAGFANTMYVVYPGDGGVWADQMQKKGWWIFGHGAKTVTQAWFTAVEDQQPSGVRARVLAEVLDNYNDYIWGQGYVSSDYSNNGAYWYWDHVAGTPPPLPLQGEAPTALPAVQVIHREVGDEYVMNIGEAFGLTSQVITSPDGMTKAMVGGDEDEKQLFVNVATGGFFYQDLGELWTDPERVRELPTSGRVAATVALSFLAEHDNIPGSFFFDQQIPPTIELEGAAEGLMPGEVRATAVITNPTDYAIHYARTVDIGGGQLLSVVGPGSRQNLYVGDGSVVVGFKGGWREIQTTGGSIDTISAEDAWQAFLADPTMAVAQLPVATEYDRTGQPEPTLAYYEQPTMMGQEELIPVWIFVADLYVSAPQTAAQAAGLEPFGLGLVADDAMIYVPAAADAAALPQASIVTPEPGVVLNSGMMVDLSGAATGGTAPYTYEWVSSVDGILGTGETVNGVVLHADPRGSMLAANSITLRVIDANGLIATATVDVEVQPLLFLPVLIQP
ncbi:MAG: hypothetical protein H6660_15950 [Ardenticatenaceae bacterium]|nr:hypothetical protein [Ardenticatenaceae bacterium]